jgi:hypothetical protein
LPIIFILEDVPLYLGELSVYPFRFGYETVTYGFGITIFPARQSGAFHNHFDSCFSIWITRRVTKKIATMKLIMCMAI